MSTHESYACISASRAQSGGSHPLFGSDIATRSSIFLRISRAKLIERLGSEWHHATEQLIEVELTEAQFATFVTSLNQGQGAPCTLRWMQGRRVADPPHIPRRVKLRQELQTVSEQVAAEVIEAEKMAAQALESGKISKAQLRSLLEKIRDAQRQVTNNMPFFLDKFERVLDQAATEVLADVRGRVEGTLREAGLSHVQHPVQIEGGKE